MKIPGLSKKAEWTNFWGNVVMFWVVVISTHSYIYGKINTLSIILLGGCAVAYLLFMMPEKIKLTLGKFTVEIEDTENSSEDK